MDLDDLLSRQDGLITRRQALEFLSENALRHRLGRYWRIVLPGVYLASTGELSERQRARAALLYGGSNAQLCDRTALAAYGVQYLPPDDTVYILLSASDMRSSRDGVRVRRTHRPSPPRVIDDLRYSPPERALAEFAARVGNDRTACAVLADSVQRRHTTAERLVEELAHVTGRGAGTARRVGLWIAAGARSAPEVEFLEVCRRSRVLPAPLLNPLLELPSGRRVSPDALFEDARLVHETNGRGPHAADDRFDDMQARHDAMTAAGLTVLHSSPRQLRTDSRRVLADVEECYRRARGMGMPADIRIVRRGADGP